MAHEHDFNHEPEKMGFDGLGQNEDNQIDAELDDTVYFMLTRCSDEYCDEAEYRSWLFETDSFEVCCDDVYPSEPSQSMDYELEDFVGPEQPITVRYTCRYCGNEQVLESDHLYVDQS